jgi:hypothetical protein
LKSEIDQRAQGESRRTRAITVEHLRRTRGKLGARSIRQARAGRWRDVAVFLPGAPRTAGASRSAMRAKTRNVFDRAHRSPRGPSLCRGAAAASPCVTAQRARCGSSRVLAHGVSGAATERAAHSAFGTDSAYSAGETRRRHSPVPDRRPARESNVPSIANCFVQQTVLNARRSPPRTAVAVMTMHLTTT